MTSDSVISVDIMGGDLGPAPIIAGLARIAKRDPALNFILHGREAVVGKLLSKRKILRGRFELREAPDVVAMDEKPSKALRGGRASSLWSALESVSKGEAKVAFSAGNTGAIVAIATFVLRRAPGVHRPAIAVHWPAANAHGFNVVLDMGADIRADSNTLVQYSVMGSEYARLAHEIDRPRIGLLNIGSEDTKGRPDLHDAKTWIETELTTENSDFDFLGFVEGNDIPTDRVDVIVTDGFTGNIAMKASEGTAAMIRQSLKEAFQHSLLSRFGALFALTSLRRLRKRIDPRRVNGGVFLGLNGGVVKSHGGADAVGHASALGLAAKMARNDFPAKVAAKLANPELQALSFATTTKNGATAK